MEDFSSSVKVIGVGFVTMTRSIPENAPCPPEDSVCPAVAGGGGGGEEGGGLLLLSAGSTRFSGSRI